jgi:citrate lyase subunit beta/citryl-CoA lyase
MTIRPRRSVLYMPGSNARALEKARHIDADCLILDLEDSVAPEAKELARAQVVAAVRTGGYGRREVLIRVNGPGTPWHEDDVAAAAAACPSGVVLPKVQSVADVERLATGLRRAGAPDGITIWAMIETPLGVLKAAEIAAASRHPGCPLAGLIVGLNDLFKETRAQPDAERTAALLWLTTVVTAARAYGLDALDSAYNDFRDPEGLRRECLAARKLGFDGKTLIHPDQVAVANEAFAPLAEEIAWAKKVLAAFERPENQGKGVINLDGRMVELLHAEMARRTLAISNSITRD